MSSTDTQEQILDAVVSVIMREGVSGASMRTVADEADVSVGLLSYHFDDKKSLITAAYERTTEQLLASSEAAVDRVLEPEARTVAWIRGPFTEEYLTEDYLALRISLWAVSRVNPDIADAERRLYVLYADKLAQLIAAARPDLEPSDINDRVTDIIVTQNGMWLNHARYEDQRDLERGLVRCESIAFSP